LTVEKLGVNQQTVNTWISDIRARQKTSRNTIILRLSRLGWTQGKISDTIGLSQNRVSEIIGNTNFGNIDNLLSQGRSMYYIARHYHMDLPLVWTLLLEGKTDQEKFKELGWGLRTWDQWNFNKYNETVPRALFQAAYHPLSRFQNSVRGPGLSPPTRFSISLNVIELALSPNKVSPVYSLSPNSSLFQHV